MLAWDDETNLWVWNQHGDLVRVTPAAGAWRLLRIRPAPRADCAGSDLEAPAGQAAPGTSLRVRFPSEDGTAVLRSVTRDDETASELWWRFTGRPREVRLAGPWGLSSPRPRPFFRRPSVDTLRAAP